MRKKILSTILVTSLVMQAFLQVGFANDVKAKKMKISISTSNLIKDNSNKKVYFIFSKLKSINGIITETKNIKSINIKTTYGKLVLENKSLKPKNKWSYKNPVLMYGQNTVTVVAKTSNGIVLKDKIKINNMANENSSNLKLDIGDIDGDKLANYEEDIFGTDKTKPDTDGDGLTDYEEVKITNTNPLKADTDGNGINDGDEDFDKDGLTNIEEVRLNGNPYSKDTDFDGLADKTEARLGTKLDQLDSDNDGFSDKEEVDLGTDPLKPNVKGKK